MLVLVKSNFSLKTKTSPLNKKPIFFIFRFSFYIISPETLQESTETWRQNRQQCSRTFRAGNDEPSRKT